MDIAAAGVVIVFLLALLTTAGNLLAILAVYKDPYHDLRTKSNYLVLNLAIADFMTGLSEPLLTLRYWLHEINYYIIACYASFIVMLTRASTLTILVLTFERFIVLEKPFSIVRLFNNVTVKVYILIIWLISFVCTLLEVFIFPESVLGEACMRYLLDSVCTIAGFLMLVSFYIRIFVLIRNFNRERERNQPGVDNPLLQSRREVITSRTREQQIAKNIFLCVGVFSICWLPYTILAPINFFSPEVISSEVRAGFLLLGFVSFTINPFIYSIRMQRFRRAIVYIFGRCCRIRR